MRDPVTGRMMPYENVFQVEGETATICIQHADGSVSRALIDAADLDIVRSWHWRIIGPGYACGRRGDESKLLHRLIANPPGNLHVDHVTGDRLDNRRSNLRVATRSENLQNRTRKTRRPSGIDLPRGVVRTPGGRYIAQAGLNSVHFYLGTFDTICGASNAVSSWRAANMPFSSEARQ